jgi:phosphosulfolactate synthase (CoM biosynthesis protein A)
VIARRTFVRALATICISGAEILQLPARPSAMKAVLTDNQKAVRQEVFDQIIHIEYCIWLGKMDPVWKRVITGYDPSTNRITVDAKMPVVEGDEFIIGV